MILLFRVTLCRRNRAPNLLNVIFCDLSPRSWKQNQDIIFCSLFSDAMLDQNISLALVQRHDLLSHWLLSFYCCD